MEGRHEENERVKIAETEERTVRTERAQHDPVTSNVTLQIDQVALYHISKQQQNFFINLTNLILSQAFFPWGNYTTVSIVPTVTCGTYKLKLRKSPKSF